MAECFYCGIDTKLTRAHLLQRRFREAIRNDSEQTTIASSSVRSGGVERDIAFPGDNREINVKLLCVNCNSGWMERIEQAAGPVFESIMRGEGMPPPHKLFWLAHWSIVIGTLATQTAVRFDIPVEQRREIRFTTTGQPQYFGTHFVWTQDSYPGVSFDFMRFEADGAPSETSWYCAIHAGPLVLISAEFATNSAIARLMRGSNFHPYLGTVSSNLVCIPDAIRKGGAREHLFTPSHHAVQELYRKSGGDDGVYVETKGGGLRTIDELRYGQREKFDYGDTLVDMRDKLDLSYLSGVF